jgi:GNAT superfamily N-acetyltransferase
MERVLIRRGSSSDLPRVLELVRELALYERAPHEVTNTVESMLADGFGEHPVYFLWVAEWEGVVQGIAICYVRYSTWKGRMLYLEDIVVSELFRGRGIGSKLFEACRDYAATEGYNGMAWQVLEWNQPALDFYRKYNALLDNEWVNAKLTREQLLNN